MMPEIAEPGNAKSHLEAMALYPVIKNHIFR
jgi:hypothetical protein